MDFKQLFRPGILATHPYVPGKPVEEVQRELGLDDVVKLASNENPEAPLPEVVVSESVTTNIAKTSIPEPLVVKPKALPEGVLLKVSETFYYDDPANSMAVVNDLPVMIGTFVDSAVVQEIHSDKVVFKIDAQTYDVPVTSQQ